MVKVHRAHRYTWWKKRFAEKGWDADIENRTFGKIPDPIYPEGRYILPFLHCNDGEEIEGVDSPTMPDNTDDKQQRYLRRLEQNRANRAQEHGIPAGIDIPQWYATYLKRDTLLKEQEKPIKKEDKEEFYRDLAIEVYESAGYRGGECVTRAYAEQGDDLMRYLSDDKRHPLNKEDINPSM